MKNLEISKVREFLNGKVKELYLENKEEVGGRVSVDFEELNENWKGKEDVMLFVYGDRGGIDIGFEYRGDYREVEDWEDLRESDSEMCVYYIFEKEGNRLIERYFDEEEFVSKERLVEI